MTPAMLPRREVTSAEKDHLVGLQHSIYVDVFQRQRHRVDGQFVMNQLHHLLHGGASRIVAEPPSPWELDKLQREVSNHIEGLDAVEFRVALGRLRRIAREARAEALRQTQAKVRQRDHRAREDFADAVF